MVEEETESDTRQVSTAASSNEVLEAWRKPPPSVEASMQWREGMESLQREYAEAVRRIEGRVAQRMARLVGQLESSKRHELPPSYPPSDVSYDTEAEPVETDPELIN